MLKEKEKFGHQPTTLKTSQLGSESGNARSAKADGD
jgi:hypothetical protein